MNEVKRAQVLTGQAPPRKAEDWMSPLNRIIWMKAFRARKTEVTIRDGRKFIVDYDIEPLVSKTTGEVREQVRVKPADGKFAPSGYLNLKEVTDPDWVKEQPGEIKQDLLAGTDVNEQK